MLKERIRAAEERRYDRRRARNCGPLYPMSSCHYRIADEVDVPVCINGFKNIFGLYRTRWEYLKKNSIGTSYIPGPVLHGNVGNRVRYSSSRLCIAEPHINSFLQNISVTYGEPYATRFIREITGIGIRDSEEGGISLPSNLTKRHLCIFFCYQQGYKIKASAKGSFGPVSEYPPREYDDILWPEGSEASAVCSWSGFLRIWNQNFPKMKIRNPCEDTCGTCVKLRNSFRYVDRALALANAVEPNADGNMNNNADDDNSASGQLDLASDDEDREVIEAVLRQQEFPAEFVIEQASIHINHAKAQRSLAKQRIMEAKADRNNTHSTRRFVFIFILLMLSFFYLSNLFYGVHLAIVWCVIMHRIWAYPTSVESSLEIHTISPLSPYIVLVLLMLLLHQIFFMHLGTPKTREVRVVTMLRPSLFIV